MNLYDRLEKDFIVPGMSDEWSKYMEDISDFLTDNYKERSMGLVCDNAQDIDRVYTAVFPSDKVMQTILDRKEKDALLFLHHPSTWDIKNAPPVFHLMNRDLLREFRENRIAIYNLHVPLDNYSEYSSSATLARVLGITDLTPFFEYYGGLVAVFGKTEYGTMRELRERFTAEMGHRTSLYRYGSDEIKGNKVAVAAGGGNLVEILEEIAAAGVNTFVTGVTIKVESTDDAHDYASEKGINITGGTHYSTEKPACQAMCGYFRKLGLETEFIEGEPGLEDL